MTISSTTLRVAYTGDGTNNALTVNFPYTATTDLVVTQVLIADGTEVVMTETTQYTVSAPGASGTVTPVDGATDFTSSYQWVITRTVPQTQGLDLVENDAFPSESVEDAFDRATLHAQDLQEQANRSLHYPRGDSAALSAEIPNSTDRASKYLGFDASSEPVVLDAPADTTAVSTFGASLILAADDTAGRVLMDSQEDVITTQGDLVRGSAANVASRLGIGTAGQYLYTDGSDPSWRTLVEGDLTISYPRGHIGGLQTTRSSATLISIGAGTCRAGSSANPDLINGINTAAFTKSFESGGWAAGTGNGGVPTAAGFAASAATWHLFILVGTDGSVDFGYDTSFTAANLVADAAVQAALTATVYYRRVWSYYSSATPDLRDYIQDGDECVLGTTIDEGATLIDGSAHLETLSVPTGFRLKVHINVYMDDTAANALANIYSPDGDATAPTSANGRANFVAGQGSGSGDASATYLEILTNASGQIGYISDTTPTAFEIGTTGWTDTRGRND